MKTEIITDYFIKGRPHQIPEIMHQEVLQIKNKIIYIRAFDLFYGEEKIKRIFLNQPVRIERTTNVATIFISALLKELTGDVDIKTKPARPKTKTKKRKVDDDARKTAAKNLFADLGL